MLLHPVREDAPRFCLIDGKGDHEIGVEASVELVHENDRVVTVIAGRSRCRVIRNDLRAAGWAAVAAHLGRLRAFGGRLLSFRRILRGEIHRGRTVGRACGKCFRLRALDLIRLGLGGSKGFELALGKLAAAVLTGKLP